MEYPFDNLVRIVSIVNIKGSRMLVGTLYDPIFIYDSATKVMRKPSHPSFVSATDYYTIRKNGALFWFDTDIGLMSYDISTGRSETYAHKEDNPASFPKGEV